MDYLSAAQHILEAERKPIHFKEIARRAMAQGLLTSTGLTPEATMGSRLYVDTKRADSRFERQGRGQFQLRRKSQSDDIARRVAAINEETRRTLHRRLHEMPAKGFELLIRSLLIEIGFDESTVEVTPFSGDGGIDVRGVLNAGNLTEVNVAVQAKRWKRNVQTDVVRDIRGSLTTHEQGIIITTSRFSSGAQTEAKAIGKAPISLIDGVQLVDLLIKHAIGVIEESHTVLGLDDEWWVEAGLAPVEPYVPQPTPPPAIVAPPSPVRATMLTFPLPVRSGKEPVRTAFMLDASGRTRFNDIEYGSPSTAGKIAAGWRSCNGWRYWQYEDPVTGEWRFIDDIRRRPG